MLTNTLLLFTVLILGYLFLCLRTSPAIQSQPAEALDDTPDQPVPFGYKTKWLAIRSRDISGICTALDLSDVMAANWRTGLAASHAGTDRKPPCVFITQPVGEWVLVVGDGLPDSGDLNSPDLATPFLERIGQQFEEVQYFATHHVVEYHAWAKVVKGRIVRAYAYVGDQGLKVWDKGMPTPEEQALGFHFFDPGSNGAKEDASYWERQDLKLPDEEDVMRLAEQWSANPTQLEPLPPSSGLIGFFRHEIQRTFCPPFRGR